jgi:diaminopimelate decarboxylase
MIDGDIATGQPCELVAAFGSPLYVIDEFAIRARLARLTRLLNATSWRGHVAYAVKANYEPWIAAYMVNHGCLLELAPGFDLSLAQRLSIAAKDLVVNGPAKAPAAVLRLAGDGARVHIDSLAELRSIVNAIGDDQPSISLGLRVRPETARWGRFGLALSELEEAIRIVSASRDAVRIRGLLVHIGTNISDPAQYRGAAACLRDAARRLKDMGAGDLEWLDIGGGFPGDGTYGDDGSVSPSSPVSAYLDAIVGELALPGPHETARDLIVEPGRHLIDDAVSLLATVKDTKDTESGRAVVLDAGTNELPSSRYRHHRAEWSASRPIVDNVSVYGPLCMEADRIRLEGPAILPEIGDVVRLTPAGAYEMSMSRQFLYARPAVVVLADNGSGLVRRRESLDDVLSAVDWRVIDGLSGKERSCESPSRAKSIPENAGLP